MSNTRQAAEIAKDIASWQKRGVKWTKDGQALGLEILAHIEAHGDVTLADKMVLGMPKGTKRNALVEWMLAFGKLKLRETSSTSQVFHLDRGRNTDLDGAKKKPWYEFSPEPPLVTVFDAQAATIAAIDKLLKASEAKSIKTVHHAEVLDRLRAMREELVPTAEADDPAGDPDTEA